jgi:hypothetical protein
MREWSRFNVAMEERFERMSVLNCYPHNLATASFDEYYWNLGSKVFACFVVNLVVFVGKYYYEVVIVDELLAHIGWTTLDFIPDTQDGEVCSSHVAERSFFSLFDSLFFFGCFFFFFNF